MLDNDGLTSAVASFKRFTSKEFNKALNALVALGFKYKNAGADFLWDMEPGLHDEAVAILRDLSDTLAEKAKEIARGIIEDSLDYFDFDAAWDNDETDIIPRLDLQGSHLLELLEIWLALAFVNGIEKGELRVTVSRYLANPFASPMWRGLPQDILKWGRGYSKNIPDQLAVIGQNAIVYAARYAEWADALAKGYEYYVRKRGSNYDCKVCDDMANKPIPIYVPFEVPHPRCMCYPVYYAE